MPRARVNRLRHVDLAAPNYEEALVFYEDAWGLKKVEQDGDVTFFAAEGSPEYFMLRMRRSDEKRIDLVSWGVDDAGAVDELAAGLATDGIRFLSEPGTLKTPGGGYGFRFFDPDGHVVEISSDVAERPYRELEDREDIPVKLSHVVFHSPNPEALSAFYEEKLGFKVSDWLGNMCFMRCTTDQHNLAIFGHKDATINHIAVEMKGLDEFMRATGRVLKTGAVLRWGPGRFGPVAENTFSFFFDPNGFVQELGTAMQQIPLDSDRSPQYVDPADNGDVWGFARPLSEDRVPASALQPDVGQWVAPPL